MPDNQNININVSGNVDVSFIEKLRTEAKTLKAELDRLKQSGQELSPAFETVKQKLAANTQAQKEWNRELKGQDAQVKQSSAQLLEMAENITVVAFGMREAITHVIEFGKQLHEMAIQGAEVKLMRNHFDEMNGGVEEATKKFEQLKKASSGNFNDKEILQYVNKLDELGISSEHEIQILDLAELASDKLGISIEDATSKMTNFIETGRNKGKVLEQMGFDTDKVAKKTLELAGVDEKSFKAADSNVQARYREAAMMQLYGRSLEEISKKEQDEADKLVAVQKELDNAKYRMGDFIANGLIKLESGLGIATKGTADLVVGIGTISKALLDVLPALGGLSQAFPGAMNTIMASVKAASLATVAYVGVIAAAIVGLIMLAEKLGDNARERYANTQQGKQDASDILGDTKKAEEKAVKEGWAKEIDKSPKNFNNLEKLDKNKYKVFSIDGKTYYAEKEDLTLAEGQLKQDRKSPKLEDLPKIDLPKIDAVGNDKTEKDTSNDAYEIFLKEQQQRVKDEKDSLDAGEIKIEQYKEFLKSEQELLEENKKIFEVGKTAKDVAENIAKYKDADRTFTNEIRDTEQKILDIFNKKLEIQSQSRSINEKEALELKNRLKSLDKDINDNRIELIENEYTKALEEADTKHNEALKKIDEDQKKATIRNPLNGEDLINPKDLARFNELRIQQNLLFKKQMEKIEDDFIDKLYQGVFGAFNQAFSLINQITTAMGISNSETIKTFQEVFGIIQSVVALIKTIQTVSSIVSGLLSFIPGGGAIGAVAGWAEGGQIAGMGTGTSDSIPAWLSNGEFVVNAQSTAQWLPLLHAINGGSSFSNLFSRYNTGGVAHSPSPINVHVSVESEVEKTKAIRFYQNTFPEFNTRQGKKALS